MLTNEKVVQMELSETQQRVFDAFIDGENIMMSGAGGVGKTTLIKSIYRHATENQKNIQVCAMTGCASILLECNSVTIHSWAGLGVNLKGNTSELARSFLRKPKIKPRFKKVDILIIDEVSMLSKKMFEILDIMGKRSRNNLMPFGGIQIVFSGDFFQLPPIGDDENESAFCFESPLWKSSFHKQIELKTIFRQKNARYIKILNQVRRGKISRKSFDILKGCIGKDSSNSKLKPTRLYPRRNMVDKINQTHLNELEGDAITFTSKITELKKGTESRNMELFKNQIPCNEVINLKVGAQVMSVVNMDLEAEFPICNGSCGIVTGFSPNKLPIVKFNNGFETIISQHTWLSNDEDIELRQIPLILAWALTIHKSQGATLDMAEIDIGYGIFAEGQTYVALSRVKDLEGLYIKSIDPWQIKANPKVIQYYESIAQKR